MCISPLFWIANMYFTCYFMSMGRGYIGHMDEALKKRKCQITTAFCIIGILQIYSMIADDFIILFVSGYIFEDIDFILKNMPAIDFGMTVISEQVSPVNAIFILCTLNYFS